MSQMSRDARPQCAPNNQLRESLQLINTNLNSLAIIATFLAGVQAQAISFSLDKQDTNLQIACNALFFGGLFIDVLSGTVAIVGAIQLQRTYTLLQQRESALTSLSEVLKDTAQSSKEFQRDNLALAHHLRFLKMIVFRLIQSPRLWNELSSHLDDADRITVAYSWRIIGTPQIDSPKPLSHQSRIRRELDSAVARSRGAVQFTAGVFWKKDKRPKPGTRRGRKGQKKKTL
ncbi:hypothetical protein B0H13DRAFT_2144587 [Mycena leptocephala]|nr:hypothetical protein B0H13DRAFT_2144587 [Mycena leptocephala]